jgi:hypothetical protein
MTFLAWLRVLEQAQGWSGLGERQTWSTSPELVVDELVLDDVSWFAYTFARRIS